VFLTPLQSDYPTDQGESVSVLDGVQSAASVSSAQLQPLQKRADEPQPHKDQAESTVETPVVLRTTALVPSSPLLKSTVPNPRALEAVPHIQADPTSPYYAFQDTRLIPNPIIRIIMENETNPRMFSLQSISPDTLSLLL
jgi:hypothetical protein